MRKEFLLILILILGINFQFFAQGDLLVTPNRVVFEGNKQKESLNLVNMGKDTATYSISVVQKNMLEDGSFVTIEKPDSGQMFADPYLRIFPRKVTLAPGEPQVIMLQCRRTPDMKDGEYRSHLYFRSEKDISPLGLGKRLQDTTAISIEVIPIFGISIPVIIRTGAVVVEATLSDLKLETQPGNIQNLKLTINRSGNISVYGNIKIEYVPVQGKPYQIGVVNGVGVYTNLKRRNISIKLDNQPGVILTQGKLKVQYISAGEGKPVIYSATEMEIK